MRPALGAVYLVRCQRTRPLPESKLINEIGAPEVAPAEAKGPLCPHVLRGCPPPSHRPFLRLLSPTHRSFPHRHVRRKACDRPRFQREAGRASWAVAVGAAVARLCSRGSACQTEPPLMLFGSRRWSAPHLSSWDMFSLSVHFCGALTAEWEACFWELGLGGPGEDAADVPRAPGTAPGHVPFP